MKLKQVKNPNDDEFVWKNNRGRICGCMVGQVVLALHPNHKRLSWLDKKAHGICINNNLGALTTFSDGGFRELSKDQKNNYANASRRLKEAYPKLNLKFPDVKDYKYLTEKEDADF